MILKSDWINSLSKECSDLVGLLYLIQMGIVISIIQTNVYTVTSQLWGFWIFFFFSLLIWSFSYGVVCNLSCLIFWLPHKISARFWGGGGGRSHKNLPFTKQKGGGGVVVLLWSRFTTLVNTLLSVLFPYLTWTMHTAMTYFVKKH